MFYITLILGLLFIIIPLEPDADGKFTIKNVKYLKYLIIGIVLFIAAMIMFLYALVMSPPYSIKDYTYELAKFSDTDDNYYKIFKENKTEKERYITVFAKNDDGNYKEQSFVYDKVEYNIVDNEAPSITIYKKEYEESNIFRYLFVFKQMKDDEINKVVLTIPND